MVVGFSATVKLFCAEEEEDAELLEHPERLKPSTANTASKSRPRIERRRHPITPASSTPKEPNAARARELEFFCGAGGLIADFALPLVLSTCTPFFTELDVEQLPRVSVSVTETALVLVTEAPGRV